MRNYFSQHNYVHIARNAYYMIWVKFTILQDKKWN